jgi:hypothetical protein
MKTYVSILSLVLSAFWCKAQNTPQLVQQVNFETGLDEVYSNKKQNAFLVISGENYTLIDQTSKIQLGTLVFNAGGWGAQGVGKTAFFGDSSILISTAFVLVQANPISGKVDTFFNQNKYPEMIENFMVWPDDENKILIHTKTYPIGDNGIITYRSDNEDITEYMGPVNCKLYLYDAVTKTTELVVETPHLITTFAPELFNGNVLAGTYDGDIVKIEPNLKQTTLIHAFDTTIHNLITCDEYIAAIPAIHHRLVNFNYGDNRICFFKDGKRTKEFVFDRQARTVKWGDPDSSGLAFRAHYIAPENSVVVNYGYSRLVNINLKTFDTAHYNITYNTAKFYCLGTDGIRLLAAMDSIQGPFSTSRMQGLYDVPNRKFLPAFKQLQPQTEYSQFYKLFDGKGNYHTLALKSDYSSDSIFVYSSNKTQPTRIACNWCKFSFDPQKQMLGIVKYKNGVIGRLRLEKLQESDYTVDTKNTLGIIDPVFSVEQIEHKKLPPSVAGIYQLNTSRYLIIGIENKNEKTYADFLVADSSGKLLIEERGHEYILGRDYAVSALNRYLAIAFKENDKDRLMVFDLQTLKKVFETKQEKGTDVRHYTFDKTKDVLWYSTYYYDKKTGLEHNLLYSVDLNNTKPTEKFEFEDDLYFSFEVDMAADRVAFEAYTNIFIAQLSTHKILWQKTPYENYIEVGHLPQGFSFSNKKELHILKNDTTYLYFTTYGQDNPVEVLNEYLYKGTKSAVNNLAFVYKRKGYLPGDYDVYFNRPDTVLRLSGSTNEEFNNVLGEAFAKRKRKVAAASLDALLTKGPELSITNQNQLPYAVKDNSIMLDIAAKSQYANIVTLHIIANGVPIFGQAGLPVTANRNIAVKQKVILQRGNNTLQVFVQDDAGIPSSTETVNVVADYESSQPKTYFVGIGIDTFKENGHNLSYSVKDIRDVSLSLKTKLGSALVIDTLFNQSVTVENVKALRKKLEQAGVNDKIIISYSGHGLLDKNFNYYLSTYPINFRNPQEGGLSYKTLETLLDGLAARKKLVLIDACHSGEVDREELDKMKLAFADTAQNLKNGSKSGIELLVDDEENIGLKNSFELMQEVFVDVGRGTGTTVISAAAGTQVAYEKGDLKNGVFTYCVLQMLNEQPNCTIQALKNYVSTEVVRLTNGLQKPTSRNETAGFDWQVW